MNTRRTNRNGGEPLGSSDPRGFRMATTDSVPLNRDTTNQGEEGRLVCNLCNDNRTFKGKIGLGQHMRQSHPVEYNRGINVEKPKARWTDEECELMAKEEAKAILSKVPNMNQHLLTKVSGRTLEGIKGKRRADEYKQMVQKHLTNARAELTAENARAERNAENEVEDEDDVEWFDASDMVLDDNTDELSDCIRGLVDKLDGQTLSCTRQLIGSAQRVLNGTALEPGTLTRWLKGIFKDAKPPGSLPINPQVIVDANVSRSARRRREYAELQKLFSKDFRGAVRRVLRGSEQENKMPPANEVIDFWKDIFEGERENEQNDEPNNNTVYEENARLRGVWSPISEEDVRTCELDLDSAAGPDGITVANWRGICTGVRTLFYNLVLSTGSLDEELKCARTVLLPKGTGDIGPGDTRPISITSVVVRQLHKIFAYRFKKLHDFDPSQRAFIDCDGTLENLSIVSTVLADARLSRKEVHIASLDLRKAFDSVKHKTIVETITMLGLPKPFIKYIKSLYTNFKTTLQYGSTNTILNVTQGVLQGDPISPLLFNAVMDRAIKQIPREVGYDINGMKINCIAYADDVISVAKSKVGLQASIDAMTKSLASFGLKINIEKSSTLSLVQAGKVKKMKVIEESSFIIDNVPLRAIGIIDTWKYLGIHFTGSRKCEYDYRLATDLDKISRAPLKPQQRLKMLGSAVLPQHLHALVLGRITKGKLVEMDRMIRTYVRKWLRLPKDIPLAYLYASVSDGGLGLFNLVQQVPLIRKRRLSKFVNKENETARAFKQSIYINRQLEWCDRTLAQIGNEVTRDKRTQYWRNMLRIMVDTNDLCNAKDDRASNTWVSNRAHEISGQDFVNYHHIRSGCLPSRARLARGRQNINKRCRAGCMASETNFHILQKCDRTHGSRILRHDRLVNLVAEHFNARSGYTVHREPHFATSAGLMKPDLLITKNNETVVMDVQVVGGMDIEHSHESKVRKYATAPELGDLIKRQCVSRTVEFNAITISYKGIIYTKTKNLFDKLDIKEHFRFMLVTSILRGGWLSWNYFNKTTTRTRRV